MHPVRRVLITGAGIGGLTAAVALRRRGIEVDLVDGQPAASMPDSGVIQPSNALRALNGIGLGEPCVAAGFGFPGWRYFDAQGARLAVVRSVNVAAPGFPAVNGISREVFLRILRDSLVEQGTPIREGRSIVAWMQVAGGVEASFDDGATARYDLVIRTDPARTGPRRPPCEAGADSGPGETLWRHDFERPAGLEWGMVFHGRSSRLALVPLPGERMSMLLVTEGGFEPGADASVHLALRRCLVEYGRPIASLRERVVDPAAVHRRSVEVTTPLVPWLGGRILRIGEAARAGASRLAEGAAAEIEEAVTLADMLSDSVDVEATLARFAANAAARLAPEAGARIRLGEWELAERSMRSSGVGVGVGSPRVRSAVAAHRSLSF